MDRRALIITATICGLLLLAAAAWHAGLVVIVPDRGANLGAARETLADAGLKVAAISDSGGAREPLDAEEIVDQRPRSGALALRGRVVELTVSPPEGEVVVPGLLGMFEVDAASQLSESGLLSTRPDPVDGLAVVYSQEPTAGTVVPFGSVVEYAAVFPHSAEASTHPGVKAVHGILYARYGIAGTDACSIDCHTANTCAGPTCHSQSAYRYLDAVTPDPK